MILIHPEQIQNLLAGAAIIGAKSALITHGIEKGFLPQKHAYAKYGEKFVRKWQKSGLLHPKRMDRFICYPTIELLVASQTEMVNRLTPMALDEIRGIIENIN